MHVMPRFNFIIQDASPLISYAGLWTEGNPSNDTMAAHYEDGFKVTADINATATLDFVGTGVTIYGAKRENHGGYSVSLDHRDRDPQSGLQSEGAFQVDLWHSHNITYGHHTVEVKNEPLDPIKSYFDVDFISIERMIGQDNDTLFSTEIDHSDGKVLYSGPWTFGTARNGRNKNRMTTSTNSSVKFSFRGCCIELYGLYTNAAYTVTLDNQSPVHMQPGIDIDLPPEMWTRHTLLYLMDGLSEERHEVSLTTTMTNAQRPFFFGRAVVLSTINPAEKSLAKNDAVSFSDSSKIGLAVGLPFGLMMLVGIIIAAYSFLRRRRRQVDKMTKPVPFNYTPASPPWLSLRNPPIRSPATPSNTIQFSSVIAGWRSMTGMDSDEPQDSTQWGRSSITRSRLSTLISSPSVIPRRSRSRSRGNLPSSTRRDGEKSFQNLPSMV